MVRIGLAVQITRNNLPQISGNLRQEVIKAVDRTAWAIAGRAKVNLAINGTNDTTALSKSIYVSTALSHTYEEAVGAATAANYGALIAKKTPKGRTPVPIQFFGQLSPSSEVEGVVGAAAEYAIFVEYGTIRMSAQPFFTPAYRTEQSQFSNTVRNALRRAINQADIGNSS